MEKIDWNYWLDMTSLEDWQACALSLGINPKRVTRRIVPYSQPPKFEYLADETIGFEKLQQFIDRLDIIQNNKYSKKFALGYGEVYLDRFVNWAITKHSFKTDFPDELARLAVQSGDLNPTRLSKAEWVAKAKEYSSKLLLADKNLNIDQLANAIHQKFIDEKIQTARGSGSDIAIGTIRKSLSEGGWFSRFKANMTK
jgi:hypothetical protein